MSKPSRYLVYTLGAIVASTLSVHPLVAATFFTEGDFDAASGSTTVIDFEDVAPSGGLTVLSNPTPPSQFSGVSFGGSSSESGFYVFSNSIAPEFSASGSDVLVDKSGSGSAIYAFLPPDVYAAGAYFYSVNGSNLLVSGPEGEFEIESGSFFGFVEKESFSEIKFTSVEGGDAVYMDNFKFTNLKFEEVPEPSSWLSLYSFRLISRFLFWATSGRTSIS